MSKQPQKQGFCIYCGGAGLTKEHIFSDWLEAILPLVADHSQFKIRQKFDHASKTVLVQPMIYKKRQGASTQRKVRNVCAICNNGWMSALVGSTRPFVEAIIREKPCDLSPQVQSEISAWIAMATIMADIRISAYLFHRAMRHHSGSVA